MATTSSAGYNFCQQYFDQHELSAYFEDVVTKLITEKPDNPLSYINDYFSLCKSGLNIINREYDYIKSTLKNRVSFVAQFTESLKDKTSEYLTVFELQQLVELLCKDFPFEVTEISAKIIGFGKNIFSVLPTFEKSNSREYSCGYEKLRISDVGKDFFNNTMKLLQDCSVAILRENSPQKVHTDELKLLEESFKLLIKKQYSKSVDLNAHPPFNDIKEAITKTFKVQKVMQHQGPNLVPVIWYEFVYNLGLSL
ncbi:hypothetical protein HDU92_001588 [Lobulomyces angularis]|nr:hypothetical protein HDU92_001588 [Lobulomyces angularis]